MRFGVEFICGARYNVWVCYSLTEVRVFWCFVLVGLACFVFFLLFSLFVIFLEHGASMHAVSGSRSIESRFRALSSVERLLPALLFR